MMRLERKYELLMKSALELTLIKLIYCTLCLLFLLDLIRVNILLHYFVLSWLDVIFSLRVVTYTYRIPTILTYNTHVHILYHQILSNINPYAAHPLPTLQNNEPIPQVLKQVVNLSCYKRFRKVTFKISFNVVYRVFKFSWFHVLLSHYVASFLYFTFVKMKVTLNK